MRKGSTVNGNHRHLVSVARNLRGMTLRELAGETGLTHVGLSHIETGRVARPHVTSKRAIADALGFEVEDLWPANGRSPSKELRQHAKSLNGAGR